MFFRCQTDLKKQCVLNGQEDNLFVPPSLAWQAKFARIFISRVTTGKDVGHERGGWGEL